MASAPLAQGSSRAGPETMSPLSPGFRCKAGWHPLTRLKRGGAARFLPFPCVFGFSSLLLYEVHFTTHAIAGSEPVEVAAEVVVS